MTAVRQPESFADRFAAASPAERKHALGLLSVEQQRELATGKPWWFYGRSDQQAPAGLWRWWAVQAGRGFGKALDVTTPMPTPAGWTTMGELQDGDWLLGADGQPTRILKAWPVQRNRPCYEVTFNDGAVIVADAEHQWTARTRADARAGRPYRTVTTREMLAAPLTVAGEQNWRMPTASPLDLPPIVNQAHPWVLGFWLGDGSSKAAEVTIGDADAEHLLGKLLSIGEPVTGPVRRKPGDRCATYPIGGQPPQRDPATGRMVPNESLHSRLRDEGVLGDKHVPARWLRASWWQREQLLAGLIDADGHVVQRTGAVEITLTRKRLALGVAELARTLGHRVTFTESAATIDGRAVGRRWRITWVARSGGGTLPRKIIPDRSAARQPQRLVTRYVTALRPVASRPVRCVTVDAPDALYLAGDRFAVTHNTRTGGEWVTERARRYPNSRTALIAPTYGDFRDTMVEGESGILSFTDFTQLRGGSLRSGWNRSVGEVYFANGSRFKGFASREPWRLRGPQHHTCFVAGTMIATPFGDRPIETLRVGDLVQTRQGPRRVTATMNRRADVVTMTHERGALTGTADHPVLTPTGWAPLGLGHGSVCLWGDDSGSVTTAATPIGTNTGTASGDTARYGRERTDRSLPGTTFTTATADPATTASSIWNASPLLSTAACMPPNELRWLGVADAATSDEVMPTGSCTSVRADTAAASFAPDGLASSVVSGVSTSGAATVYNLTVSGPHEYVADGVVVHNCWGDEPSYWRDAGAGVIKDTTFFNANVGLRLPRRPGWPDDYRPAGCLTFTPRMVPLIKVRQATLDAQPAAAGILQRDDVAITNGTTMANLRNLDASYYHAVVAPLLGTTLGLQELDGVLIEEVEGALWSQSQINADRVGREEVPAIGERTRTVVGYDPSGSATGDEHGIIVTTATGTRDRQHAYVLADHSGSYEPGVAAQHCIVAAFEHSASAIVYEKNQGQRWIPTVFAQVWETLRADPEWAAVFGNWRMPPLEAVDAVRDKATRARPVVNLSQQHRVHHVQTMPLLEAELTTWMPPEPGEKAKDSPNRLDAYVWSILWLYDMARTQGAVSSPARRERGGRRANQPSSRLPAVYGTSRSR